MYVEKGEGKDFVRGQGGETCQGTGRGNWKRISETNRSPETHMSKNVEYRKRVGYGRPNLGSERNYPALHERSL